jgi:hypothetical protein
MKRNQLGLLLVLVVVLGIAGFMLNKRQHSTWQTTGAAAGKKLLGEFPINNVTRITIRQATNEVKLAKVDNTWRVKERSDYPANFSEIGDLLIKLADLKIVQTEKAGPSQLPRLELVAGQGSNSATVAEFRDQNDKVIRTLLLGKKHTRKAGKNPQFGDMGDEGYPDGRFVKTDSSSDDVQVISDPLSNLEPKPEQWLNKDFVHIERPKSIQVTYPVSTNSWKLTRETESGEWKLADAKPGEQLDSSKASGVSNPLSSASFNDVAPASQAAQMGLDKPTVATIETFDNFSYTVKVGAKTNDNYPLMIAVVGHPATEREHAKDEKAEDKDKLDKEFKTKQKTLSDKLAQEKTYEKWIYLVSNWTLDSLLKERAQLLAEKKEEPKAEEPKTGTSTTNAAVPATGPAVTATNISITPPAASTNNSSSTSNTLPASIPKP